MPKDRVNESTCGITTLNHEALNAAVKLRVIVVSSSCERDKILRIDTQLGDDPAFCETASRHLTRLWDFIAVQLDFHITQRCVDRECL